MMPENIWRRVRSAENAVDKTRKVLLSGVFQGVRLYCEKHWSAPDQDGERKLMTERYYSTDPDRAYRTAEAALAATLQPVEDNQP